MTLLRSAFWLVLLATLLYGALHSALAAQPVKDFARSRVGDQRFAYYHFAYNLIAGLTLLPLAALVLLLPDRILYRIPAPWIYLTLALQGGLLVCALLAYRQSRPVELFSLRRTTESTPLLTTGFYSLSRHPLYLFGILLMALFPYVTANLLGLFLGFALYILVGSRLEERRLLREHGEQYRAYMRATPWIFPNPLKLLRK